MMLLWQILSRFAYAWVRQWALFTFGGLYALVCGAESLKYIVLATLAGGLMAAGVTHLLTTYLLGQGYDPEDLGIL